MTLICGRIKPYYGLIVEDKGGMCRLEGEGEALEMDYIFRGVTMSLFLPRYFERKCRLN